MFMGEYNHTIDAKGRLIIPSKFRETLGDEFVVTKGLDGCLFVYDNKEWSAFEEKLKSLPLTNKDARQFVRFFLAGGLYHENISIVTKIKQLLLCAVVKRMKIYKILLRYAVQQKFGSFRLTNQLQLNTEKYLEPNNLAHGLTEVIIFHIKPRLLLWISAEYITMPGIAMICQHNRVNALLVKSRSQLRSIATGTKTHRKTMRMQINFQKNTPIIIF